MLTAKAHSDRRNWDAKHRELTKLIRAKPDEWFVDDESDVYVVGITHAPTEFKFHIPREKLPHRLNRVRPSKVREKEAADWDLLPLAVALGPAPSAEQLQKQALDLSAVPDTIGALTKPFGGPSPLSVSLLLGAAGAGAGYGAGKLYDATIGRNRYVEEGRAPKSFATMGGILGAGLPLSTWGIVNMAEMGPKGLVSGWPGGAFKKAELSFSKAAAVAGGYYGDAIPVDNFNRMVLSDAAIPPVTRALSAGIVEAASRRRGGSRFISPVDVAHIAVGAGAGYLSGAILGKTFGMIGGLAPNAQQALSRTGALAGAVNSAVGVAFGR